MRRDHEICQICGQSISYELDIDKGSYEILKAIVRHVKEKGINAVHLNKELCKVGMITVRQLDNSIRLKFHGLIANIPGERGNYCITDKGFDFLNGEPISRTVIVMKRTKGKRAHVIGHSDEQMTIDVLDMGWGEYWSANGYQIIEGRVITEMPIKRNVIEV